MKKGPPWGGPWNDRGVCEGFRRRLRLLIETEDVDQAVDQNRKVVWITPPQASLKLLLRGLSA